MPSDDKVKEAMPLIRHMTRPARSVGTSYPGEDKSPTPTKPLPPIDDGYAIEKAKEEGEIEE